MTEQKQETLLKLLKADLQRTTTANDVVLKTLLVSAEFFVKREGIVIVDDEECDTIIWHYAAYLFRKRAASDASMPRYLRYELNNYLFAQKAKVDAS